MRTILLLLIPLLLLGCSKDESQDELLSGKTFFGNVISMVDKITPETMNNNYFEISVLPVIPKSGYTVTEKDEVYEFEEKELGGETFVLSFNNNSCILEYETYDEMKVDVRNKHTAIYTFKDASYSLVTDYILSLRENGIYVTSGGIEKIIWKHENWTTVREKTESIDSYTKKVPKIKFSERFDFTREGNEILFVNDSRRLHGMLDKYTMKMTLQQTWPEELKVVELKLK